MADLKFGVHSEWADGEGRIHTGGQVVEYSGPASMGGKGKGTSPEELMMSGVVACYSGTLAGVLHRAGLPVAAVHVDAAGFVTDYPERADFSRLVVSPVILGGDAGRLEEYRHAALRARDRCFIGRVVRDHLSYEVGEVRVEPAGRTRAA